MEQPSPVKVLSRKRKKAPPSSSYSDNSIGVQTRSKSLANCHQNRFGMPRSDTVTQESSCLPPEIEIESAKVPPEVNHINEFKPACSLVHIKEEEEEKKKALLRSTVDPAPGSSPVLDLVPSEAHDEQDTKKDSILVDWTGNSSVSESKMVNRCGKRKVFKAPSSFSYRRLLPFLTDILNDGSSVPKIEIVDSGLPRKLQKLDSGNSSTRSMVENSCTGDFEHSVPNHDATSLSENGEVPKFNAKLVDQQNLSGVENALVKTEEIVRPMEVGQQCNESGVNKTDAATEGCYQMTPPELDVNTKRKFGYGDSMEANNMQVEDQDFKGLSIGSEKSGNDGGGRQSAGDKAGDSSTNRSVLSPFSQLTLFKNPGSVSYRRLLPYLMDISKNITSDSKVIRSPVPLVDLKEELHPLSTPIAEQNCENSREKQHTENRLQTSVCPTVPLQPPDDSLPDSVFTSSPSMPTLSNNSSTSFEPSSTPSETLLDPRGLNDLQTAEVTRLPPITPRNLEPCFDMESGLPLSPPPTIDDDILNKESTSEEYGKAENQIIHLHSGLELQNHNNEFGQNANVNQGSCHSGGPEGLVTPISGPFKGILKRNRLGCRGLCNCLNCSSFRLHADRSFEFSRNQMHDAEDIASELMKELENLRILLEKSASNDNGLTAIQLDPARMKEVCNRAIKAQNLAKERLSQLNYDLSVHCRIPVLLQPRVTFANHIQERVTLPSSSTEKNC